MDGTSLPEDPPLSPGETTFLGAKTETIEIDIGEWCRETLEFLIRESCDRDISVNDVIIELINNKLDNPPVD